MCIRDRESGIIISINNDENAPINTIADYVINGTVEELSRIHIYHTYLKQSPQIRTANTMGVSQRLSVI